MIVICIDLYPSFIGRYHIVLFCFPEFEIILTINSPCDIEISTTVDECTLEMLGNAVTK